MLRVKYVANCSREYSAGILKYFVWHIVAMQEVELMCFVAVSRHHIAPRHCGMTT